jgi:hypothetical protein
MANRFDTPQKQEYVSQYVPMPLEYLSGLAKDYTNQYKKAEEDVYALGDLMGKVKSIDEHQPYKKQLEAEFKPRIESLADQFVKGADLPSATRELNKLKRDWVNNPLRQELETSYAEKAIDKENARKLGVKYQDWLDPNSKFKGYSETGELVPYRANVIPEALDIEKRFSEAMKGIRESTKGWDIEGIDETGIKIGQKGLQSGITPERVMNLAKDKVKGILDGTLEGTQFKQKMKYFYPNATDKQIEDEAVKQMFASGSEQIFSKTESGKSMDVTDIWGKKYDERKAQEDFQRLPMQELPVIAAENVTNKDALSVFNLGKNVDEEGKPIYASKLGRVETQVDGRTVSGAQFDNNAREQNIKNLTDFYTGLNNTAKNLNIPIPKLPNGKTDYKKLQDIITSVGKDMLVNGQVGQGLQTELSNNMTSYYLGTTDSDGETFKKSPFLQTAKITDVSDPSKQIISEEDKNKIAKNGVIKDINFYAEKPGTFVITSSDEDGKSKNYNIYLGEKVSKALIEPTWNLTNSFDRNIKGQVSTEEANELYKNENKLGADLANQYNNIKDERVKGYLLNNLQNVLGESKNMKTVSIVNSAEKTQSGNPKYIFIGKQGIDPNTYSPVNKVIVVNQENGDIQYKDLNEVQAMESSYIQENISRGYKPRLGKNE